MAPTPRKILLIDNNANDRAVLRRWLQRDAADDAYVFQEASSGQEGLATVTTWQPDCVVLDYRLPDFDGLQLLTYLHDRFGTAAPPVVMLTGSGTELIAVDAMKRGACDYLPKAVIAPDLLHKAVANALDKAALRRQVDQQHEELQRNMQALEQSNAALQQANQELNAFAYVASHDLKEPLRGIATLIEFLREDSGPLLDREARERLQRIQRLTARMDTLLDALLHYARVGQKELEFTTCSVSEIIQDAIEVLHEKIQHAGVQLRIAATWPVVRGDRMQLTEVFTNLLSNALKYNDKPDKWIELGVQVVTSEEQQPVLYVRDNGIGIAMAQQHQIFEMFRRLHLREEYGGGAGVGLTIVKKVVERHGGRIWVESTQGTGSTFFFTVSDGSSR